MVLQLIYIDHLICRRELDNRNSTEIRTADGTGALSDAMNPWGCLSSRYCDYNSFTPQNGLIQYTHGRDGLSRPTNPIQASSDEYTCLSSVYSDLNPSNKDRQSIIRDGAWLKEHWTKIRGYVSLVLAAFNRSGQQSGKDISDITFNSPEEQAPQYFPQS
jgi:hypothetical protein